MNKKRKKKKMSIKQKRIIMSIMIIISTLITLFAYKHFIKPEEVSYLEFLAKMQNKQVDTVYIRSSGEKFIFTDIDGNEFTTYNPKTADFREYLLLNDIEIIPNKEVAYLSAGLELFKTFIMISLMLLLINKMGLNLLTKKESLVMTSPSTKFDDIAGNEEAKEDMKFLVNFLKNPEKYNEMGAKLPKGVVLYGPPGTGKTLTAKAIAGEANVPFFNVSGSDFIELYAGLGAKRVRDLFEDARENAPCIIFIDEIDAIGTHRGNGVNDTEKNQTINALLAELDGFNSSEPIVTMIATNRVEDLDKALIRPGRFDKHIAIELPESRDRLAILTVYAKNKKISKDVDLQAISKLTIGFSGAALEALMNESAILAVNNNNNEINMEHINEAYFKMVMGGHKKKNAERDDNDIKLIAYHEAGHALISKLLTDNDVPKVTIVPSTTGAGGATFTIPKKMGLITKRELLNSIKILYAGRAAEYVLKQDENEITTGAANDIKMAEEQIKKYYKDYGMSEFGMFVTDEKAYGESARRLSKKLYEETVSILNDNSVNLDNIAKALIEKETINEKELDDLIEEAIF